MEYLEKVVDRLYDLHRIKDEYFKYPYPIFGDDVLKFDSNYFKAFVKFEIVMTNKHIKWKLEDSNGFFDKSWLKFEVVDKDTVETLIRDDIKRKIFNLEYSIDCNEIEMDGLKQMLNTEFLTK